MRTLAPRVCPRDLGERGSVRVARHDEVRRVRIPPHLAAFGEHDPSTRPSAHRSLSDVVFSVRGRSVYEDRGNGFEPLNDTEEYAVPQPPNPSTARARRADLIKKLREKRGSDVLISYITSTRPNGGAQMGQDAIRRFVDLLPPKPVDKIDLFLHSNGGDGIVPWRLMTLLREYAKEVDVLVPSHAFSAATLACLGADKIVMHPMGMLGPIDPTVGDPYGDPDPQTGQPRGVSVEDVAAYIALVKEDVGIRHEDELVQAFAKLADKVHPLTLGHAKRGTAQARMLGEKLLRLRDPQMESHKISTLIEELTTKLYYHGHPIGRREAEEDLELHVGSRPRRSRAPCGSCSSPTRRRCRWTEPSTLWRRHSQHPALSFRPRAQSTRAQGNP